MRKNQLRIEAGAPIVELRQAAVACVVILIAAAANGPLDAACNEVEAPLSDARVALASGELQRAEKILQSAAASAPDCVTVWISWGKLAMAKGDYAAADRLSQRAVAVASDSPEALALRGQIIGMKGDLEEAERFLENAARLDAQNPERHFQLGMLYDQNQEHQKAIERFEKVIALNPSDPRAYDYLALNLEPLGRIERAEKSYQQGLIVNRGPLFDGFLDYNYGRFLMKQNRLEQAGKHLDRAVELAPQTRAVYYERAKLHLKQQAPELARRDAERALSLKDEAGVILDLQVYYLLVRIYSRLGERGLAKKYADLGRSTEVPVEARVTRNRGR